MSQEAQIAERSANSESYHLSRSVFCVATSLFSRESTGKTAALQRSIFGRWLTPCDDAEHKPAQNEVCASSHSMDAIPKCHYAVFTFARTGVTPDGRRTVRNMRVGSAKTRYQ